MQRRTTLVSAVLVIVCGAILVVFTDVELRVVEWINCGPRSLANEQRSAACR
jgi:hypothetical protein